MSQGVLGKASLQRGAVCAHEIDIETGAVLHRFDLPALKANKALQLGKPLQQFCLGNGTVSQLLEIGQSRLRRGVCTGQQQRIQLHRGCRNGKDLNYVFFFRFVFEESVV